MSSELPKESKDKVIFLTEEEAAEPSKVILQISTFIYLGVLQVSLGEPEEHPPGLILPNGDINWNCPCLGGMAVGPCGVEFREAFSCFHYSEAEPKGSDCIEKFAEMQKCMQGYPELFEEKERASEKSDNKESPGEKEEPTNINSDSSEVDVSETKVPAETSVSK